MSGGTEDRSQLPTVHGSMQAAAVDLFEASWRFTAANALWGVALIAGAFLAILWPPLVAALAGLAIPTAGLMRMAGVAVRGGDPRFADFVAGSRERVVEAALVGAAALVVLTICVLLITQGSVRGDETGVAISAIGVLVLIPSAVLLVAAWPLLTDPAAPDRPLAATVRLALRVALVRPASLIGLTLALTSVTAFFAALTVLLLIVGVAYVCLVAAHFVLPWADVLEHPTST